MSFFTCLGEFLAPILCKSIVNLSCSLETKSMTDCRLSYKQNTYSKLDHHYQSLAFWSRFQNCWWTSVMNIYQTRWEVQFQTQKEKAAAEVQRNTEPSSTQNVSNKQNCLLIRTCVYLVLSAGRSISRFLLKYPDFFTSVIQIFGVYCFEIERSVSPQPHTLNVYVHT